jgi:hypothetical protein
VRERIGYLHVPKAAGTSVTDAIRRAVIATAEREERVISICSQVMDRTLYGSFDRYDELSDKPQEMIFTGPVEQLAVYDVVVGHFSAASLRPGRGDDDLAVLFREPRARLMSHYSYWSSWSAEEHAAWDPYDGSRHAADAVWPDLLVDEALASQIDNVATRLVLSPHPLIPADGFIADHDLAEVTSAAVDALGRFGFVDAIENGPQCWSRLGDWAGLELDVGHRNVTEDADADPSVWAEAEQPVAVSALAARTAVDRRLWLTAMSRNDAGRSEADVVAEGDHVASEQLRKLSGGTAPRDSSWAFASRRELLPELASVSPGRRAARAWRRVARPRDR